MSMARSALPPSGSSAGLAGRLASARRRARRVLRIETAWPALQWPAGLIGTYALSGLVRIPQSLPDTLHAFLLAGVAGGAIALAARALSHLPSPSVSVIDRRIEKRSGLRHRPLSALGDSPADHSETLLWQTHMARLQDSVGVLKTGWPHLRWTRGRAAGWCGFALTFGIALLLAGPAAPSRLEAAFMPGIDDSDVPLPQLEAWIDLPDYAPGAPVYLTRQQVPPVLPQNALLNLHVTDARSGPHLLGPELTDMTAHQLDDRSWSMTARLQTSGRITLRSRGRTLGEWLIRVEPDLAPEVAWTGSPHTDADTSSIALPWQVSQAHGITSLVAEITREQTPDKPPVIVPIPLDGMPKKASGTRIANLTASLWAGEKVSIRLHATSRSGKEAHSKPETMRLPVRVFHDPTARALIALRHRFGLDLESTLDTISDLRALAETLPVSEKGAILALDYAASQLSDPDADNAREHALGLCWTVALYLEDLRGQDKDAAQANLDIRAAQQAVHNQIAHMHALGPKGQSEDEQEELALRMKTLRNALDRRMQALMKRSMQMGTVIPDIGSAPDNGTDPVSRLMHRLQSDAANGHDEEALKRLDDLAKMAERMRTATPEDLANIARQLRAQAQAQQQRMTLRDLVRRETSLLDHVQGRLGLGLRAAKEAEQNNGGQDIQSMPTSELLRRLGLTPPPDLQDTHENGPPLADAPDTPSSHEQRRSDHATQRALHMLAEVLNEDIKTLTGKTLGGLTKAGIDMKAASHALASAQDPTAEKAIRQVLKDLAESGQQMAEAQKGKKHGGGPVALLPTMGTGGTAQGASGKGSRRNDDSEDQDGQGESGSQKDRDPLGRKLGKGHSGADDDGTIPQSDSREKARAIERELRRRDADRTRSQEELDYLDRLLRSY